MKDTSWKIRRLDEVVQQRKLARDWGDRVVFTNGCFDLLHAGHVSLLERAAALGDLLVVAVNTDRSVRKLKGAGRPLVPEQQRARLVAALACVDDVVLFDDPTPLRIVNALRPDVLVKGADWRGRTVAGADEVRSWGGRLCLLPLIDGLSTSAIIERCKEIA